jgi:hypothetical protein
MNKKGRPDFEATNKLALPLLPKLLRRWLPTGRVVGDDFASLKPPHKDRNLGFISIL